MRWWALACVFGIAGCSVDRDLTEPRFACERGGSCAADGGAVDSGARDGGATPSPDGGPASCLPGWGLADACGGALGGSWTLMEVCGGGWFERELQDSCPGALVQTADIVGTGRLSFDETRMAYTVSQALDVDADFTIPSFCRPTSCVQSAGVLAVVLGGEATCEDNASGGCDCNYDGPIAFTQDGEYELDGEQFVLEPNSAGELTFPYCVDGAQLTYAQNGTTFIAER